MASASPAFDLINPGCGGPLVLSVPHAGRDYMPVHRAMIRPPVDRVIALEDRLVDAVVYGAGAPTIIANAPRAWIDLNRHEGEIDPGLVHGLSSSQLILSPRVRSGLGLIPRRLAGVGEIWRGKLSSKDVEARIEQVHRPYHAQLAGLLKTALGSCGIAILLDLHSMPPVSRQGESEGPRIVVGNRFGHSAAQWITARIGATCARFGLSWQENSPYAGGHIVERHGTPARGIHAVQLELDRSLYLDQSLEYCAPEGLAFCRRFLRDVVADLTAAALDAACPLAAE